MSTTTESSLSKLGFTFAEAAIVIKKSEALSLLYWGTRKVKRLTLEGNVHAIIEHWAQTPEIEPNGRALLALDAAEDAEIARSAAAKKEKIEKLAEAIVNDCPKELQSLITVSASGSSVTVRSTGTADRYALPDHLRGFGLKCQVTYFSWEEYLSEKAAAEKAAKKEALAKANKPIPKHLR